MRACAVLVLIAAAGGNALAQAPAAAPREGAKAWSFAAAAYTYIVPDSANYVQPTVTADRGWLHLEARYNYEDLHTASAWLGYAFSAGERLALEFTPMLGAVFGNTDGIAPGYRVSLSWRALEFSSESEYVIDAGSSTESFLYTWSELGAAPAEWFRFGFVVQRTKAYKTDFDIQRGFFAGVSYGRADVAAYIFNPDDHPTVVVALSARF